MSTLGSVLCENVPHISFIPRHILKALDGIFQTSFHDQAGKNDICRSGKQSIPIHSDGKVIEFYIKLLLGDQLFQLRPFNRPVRTQQQLQWQS